jgi:hypothetical protein
MARFGQWLDDLEWEATGQPSPAAKRLVKRVVRPLVRAAFRPTITGLEHLPAERPFIVVANHSAGIALAELMSLVALWPDMLGDEVPLAGFAHPAGFQSKAGRWMHRHLGTVPSTQKGATAALADGISLMVFPGGDYECQRSFWESNTVDFGGRTGFLRIAREAGVPIVPLGIRGSHHTVPFIFGRSELLANVLILPKFFGVRRWALSGLGIAGALGISRLRLPVAAKVVMAAAWMGSPLIFLPVFPATLKFRIGPALTMADLFGPDGDRTLEDVRDEVERAVQSLVDQLK